MLIFSCNIAIGQSLVQLPDFFVGFETDNAPEYAVVVEKSSQQLIVFKYDGSFSEIHRFNCSTGQVYGPKLVEGDKKTPEGIYYFIKRYEKKDLTPLYGIRAFPIDYPNFIDKYNNHTGNSIWLHGTNKKLIPTDSQGCVALENSNLNLITPLLSLNRTPIIIVEKISYVPVDYYSAEKNRILAFLLKMNSTLQNSAYNDYQSYYDRDYSNDLSWFNSWKKIQEELFVVNSPFYIKIKPVSILKYNDIYVTVFDQVINFSGKELFLGTKKLFLTQKNGVTRIIHEKYLVSRAPYNSDIENSENRMIASIKYLMDSGRQENEISNTIDRWLAAWSSKDMRSYGNFYDAGFRSQGMGLNSWLRHKANLAANYDYIRITRENLKVRIDGKTSQVSFIQNYFSSGYSAVGIKHLVLVLTDGNWKIYRESWEKI